MHGFSTFVVVVELIQTAVQSLDVAVQLAVVVSRNVHVLIVRSASGVALICDFVKGSIQALVDGTKRYRTIYQTS
jgi:hypothetical protein